MALSTWSHVGKMGLLMLENSWTSWGELYFYLDCHINGALLLPIKLLGFGFGLENCIINIGIFLPLGFFWGKDIMYTYENWLPLGEKMYV